MTLDEIERALQIHERQIRDLRDNQRVQGELLNRTDNTLAFAADLVRKLAEQMVILQAGLDAMVKSMDTLRKSLEGGNGRPTKQ